jgi:branched-chain amino acid transport system ATP-binding protein
MTAAPADAGRIAAPLLEVHGISAGYGDLIAIRDVGFQVAKGELVAVIGRNGAGKSTTLLTVQGILKARAGSVVLDGQDVTTKPVNARISAGLSCVPEGRQVFRRRTVLENLKLGTYPLRLGRAERRTRVERALERFPTLAAHRGAHAHQLSGGQQQLLAIAQALMAEPRVLLLDEPSAGLSPGMFAMVLDIVDELRTQGTAIVLVEQLVGQIMSYADRLVILDQGRVVHVGVPGDEQFDIARDIYLSQRPATTGQAVTSEPHFP